MRSRSAWLVAALGVGAALASRVRRARRGAAAPAGDAPPAVDPRAEELRRKLDQSRTLVSEREEFESGETTVDEAEPPPADPSQRRREVHEQGRSALDEMRGA